ncbi:unnamed protein product [Bemisia tabaci]|uniref:Lipase n=1 Tax=Bemisia tabaci TaxID=7038 RepID=A0A9P0AGM3_BEMTA|nr:unnamed protein product [Bemisia tabaci]
MEWQSQLIIVLKFLVVCLFVRHVGAKGFKNPETGTVWKIVKSTPEPNFEPYLLSTSQLIREEGFFVEEHAAQTEDGYILGLHRIVNPAAKNSSSPPVLIMHGFLIASDNWLIQGRDHDLPYLMADADFDVWLGDFRGNCYSRRHETLSPNDDLFWDFGPHEWGYYDLPAMIEYIRHETKKQQITYVGYSIGGGAFYLMCSTRPYYNNYITSAIMLAPFVYGPREKKIRNNLLNFAKHAIRGHKQHERFEVFKRTPIHLKAVQRLTRIDAPSFKIMFLLFMDFFGDDIDQLDMLKFKQIASAFGAGTSLKAMEHMVQLYESREFRKFDFGRTRNKKYYGTIEPPQYNLTKVTVPSCIYYGANDYFVDFESIERLSKILPNVVKKKMVPHKKFNHLDFLVATDAKALLYDDVISDAFRIINSE